MDGAQEPGPSGVVDILSRLDDLTSEPNVEVRQIVKVFGAGGFVPMMLAPALIVVSPLSGIPLLPTVMGLTIALIAGQMVLGRRHVWLPEVLMRRRIGGYRLHRGLARVRGGATWLDGKARNRMRPLVQPPLDLLPKLACMLCGLSMPFLELVPFSSSLLGAAVVLIGAGMLARDGLFALLAAGFIGIAAMVPLLVYGGIFSEQV